MTRPLKLAGAEAHREPGACGDAGGAGDVGDVGAWLEVVVRLCGLPEGERSQIRDELRDHIEGRVRDLMLTGRGEAEAGAEAIGELGDAAELARNLRAARRRPQRRRLMATMIGAAAAAVIGVGALVWQPGERPAVSTYAPAAPAGLAEVERARVSLAQGARWCDLFEAAGKASGHPVVVHWSSLEGPGAPETRTINREGDLGLEVESLPLGAAMGLVNDARNLNGEGRVDWRMMEGTLVFATRGYFDRAEMVLKTYDLAAVEGATGEEGVEKLVELIKTTAEPDAWADGGGSATASAYGTKLFVKAPPRVHSGVEWVLGELREKEGRAAGGESVRVFALKRTDASEAAEVVRKLLREERAGVRVSAVSADARTNSLVVKGTPAGLMLVEGCLGLMDAGTGNPAANQTRAFPMRHVSVGRAMEAVKPMITSSELRGQIESASTDAATNSLVVVGTAGALDAVQKRLERLDAEGGEAPGAAPGAAPGGAGLKVQDQDGGAGGVPAAVLKNIGPGEVVRLEHADAGDLAPVVARRLVEWSREVGGQQFVVTRQGDGVLVAGTPLARERATAMLRELDEVVGRAGRADEGGGGAFNPGAFGASATLTGLRRTGVPVLSNVPLISSMFRSETPAPVVIRAEGGLIRVTAPDGTSVETEEIRVAPSGK